MSNDKLKDLMVLPKERQTVSLSEGVRLTSQFDSGSTSSNFVMLEADSIENFLNFQTVFDGMATGHRRCSRTNSPSQSWDLNVGWDGYQKVLSEGWKAGVSGLKTAQANFPSTSSFGKIPDTDVAGGSLCVATFCSGAPDYYDVDPEEDSLGETKVIKLVVPVGATAGYSAEYLFNRGAGIVASIQAIERSGKQCEVWAESAATSHGEPICQRVLIKWAGAPLDLNTMAVWLAHPATFRRLFFSGRECLWNFKTPSGSVRDILDGDYGSTCRGPTDKMSEGTIYLPLARDGYYGTPKSALQTLTEIFKSAGFALDFGDLSNMK
jgi:hypothetical protein